MSIQSIPHGWYSVVATALTTFGWLLGWFQDGCDFVRVEGDLVAKIASQPNAPYLEAGRKAYREPYYNPLTDSWGVEYVGQCLVYPADHVETDVWWNAAKGFDFASMVLGGTCSLFLCFSVCCVFSRGSWRLAGFQVLLASLFQAASFVWFRTEMCQENTCSLFWGSSADIGACFCWLITAILIFCHYPVPKDHLSRQYFSASGDNDNRDGIIVTRPNISSSEVSPTVDEYGAPITMSETVYSDDDVAKDLEFREWQEGELPHSGQQSGEGTSQENMMHAQFA